MEKVVVNLLEIDKDILKKIRENDVMTFSMLTADLKWHRSMIWKRLGLLKRAGIIENADGLYKISDSIDISQIEEDNKMVINPKNIKLNDMHKEVLKILYERENITKLAFIKYKLNQPQIWTVLNVVEDLCFLGLVTRKSKGIYEISNLGKEYIKEFIKDIEDEKNIT